MEETKGNLCFGSFTLSKYIAIDVLMKDYFYLYFKFKNEIVNLINNDDSL